ncbi:MAG TPA: hypothetical protein VGD98_07435 [Ktedonobacteraceae bacterium]
MLSILSGFPLVLTTSPLFIVLAYLSQFCTLLGGVVLLASARKMASSEGAMKMVQINSRDASDQKKRQQWETRLHAFRITSQDDNVTLDEIRMTDHLLSSPFAFVAGLTWIVLSLLNLFLFVFTRGAIFHNLPLLLVLGTIFPLSSVLQRMLTIGMGFWRVKQALRQRVAYADLSERHVSDYRSPLFRWLFLLLVVANCLLLLWLPTRSGLTDLPVAAPFLWMRLIICCSMLATVLVGEICLLQIVRLPRLVVIPDPLLARRADDLLRALTINNTHKGVVGSLKNYLLLQWFFFLPWLLSSPILFSVQCAVTIFCLLCWAPTVLPNSDDEKYLGGKKTGWPWRKEVVVS